MNTFVFAGQIDGYRSLQDRSLKISIVTSTEASPEIVANISNAFQHESVIAVSPHPFTVEQIDEIDKTTLDKDDTGKTPAQRQRAVLFLLWQQNNERYDVFEDFYRAKMEKIITHLKSKLP